MTRNCVSADIEMIFSTAWKVHHHSDRTGVRLIGPHPTWARTDGGEAGLHPSNIHDNAYAIGTIDFTGKTTIADAMVVTSGTSTRHVGSLADRVLEDLAVAGVRGARVEGMPHCDWVLIDAGDVIVHVFRPEVRAFYNLEKMWSPIKPHGGERGKA